MLCSTNDIDKMPKAIYVDVKMQYIYKIKYNSTKSVLYCVVKVHDLI